MEEDDHPREQPRHRGRSPSSLTDEVRVCVYLLSGVLSSHRMAGGAWLLRGARVETAVSKEKHFFLWNRHIVGSGRRACRRP